MPKNINKFKLASKITGVLFVIAGATLVIIGYIDFIKALTGGEEPQLFLCSLLGIPTFFIGFVLSLFGFLRKVNVTLTKEIIENDSEAIHKITVVQSNGVGANSLIKMICPSCNKENDSDSAFCKHCGTKLI